MADYEICKTQQSTFLCLGYVLLEFLLFFVCLFCCFAFLLQFNFYPAYSIGLVIMQGQGCRRRGHMVDVSLPS